MKRITILASSLTLLLILVVPCRGAAFIKFDGIDGESADAIHKGAIDVESFSWGLSNSGPVAGGGGVGKAVFQELHFRKPLDKSSPILALKCATGAHLKSATLFVRKAGESRMDYYIVTLQEVFVTSVSQGGGGSDGAVTEDVSLSYATIEWEYVPVNPDGTAGTSVKAGWDVKGNVRL